MRRVCVLKRKYFSYFLFMTDPVFSAKKNASHMAALVLIIIAAALFTLLLTSCDKRTDMDDAESLTASYDMHVAVEKDLSRIYVTGSVYVTNGTDTALETLEFYMYAFSYESGAEPGAYFKSTEKKWAKAEVNIGGASSGGIPLDVERDGVSLIITLPEPLAADCAAEIKLAYTILNPASELGYGLKDGVLKLTDFHPVLKSYSDGNATEEFSRIARGRNLRDPSAYKVTYSIPNSVSIATNLSIKSDKEQDGTRVVECAGDGVKEAAAVIYSDGRTILGAGSQPIYSDSETVLGHAVSALSAYSAVMGGIPFERLSVVTAPIYCDQISVQGLVMVDSSLGGDNLKRAVLEGVATQYFGAATGAETSADFWITDGSAYYLSEYFFAAAGMNDEYTAALTMDKAGFSSFIEEQLDHYPGYNATPARPLEKIATINEYNMVKKAGTAIMYDVLRAEFGDKKIKKALRALYEGGRGGRLDTDEAAGILADELGRGAADMLSAMLGGGISDFL